MPLPRLIPVKSPSGQRTAELSGFCWSLCPKKRKWWIISGYAYCPRLFTRLVITRFWRIEQYPLQNFSNVCALIRNIFVTMSDARFAKCADSADAPEVSFALLSTFLLCINAGEDKEALIPFFFFFSPFGITKRWSVQIPEEGWKKMTRHSVVFMPRTCPRSINSDASAV